MGEHIVYLSGSVDHRGILVRDLDMTNSTMLASNCLRTLLTHWRSSLNSRREIPNFERAHQEVF